MKTLSLSSLTGRYILFQAIITVLKTSLPVFALQHRQELQTFLEKDKNPELLAEWLDIQNCEIPSNQENFLYYILKKYQQTPEGRHLLQKQIEIEENCAILNIPGEHSFDVEAQVIKLSCLDISKMDPRLKEEDISFIEDSDALILNIDYPLGLSAYNILGTISEHVSQVLGIYLMGKAATLNGVIGDVMIPNVVHDEHSQNTYLFQNAFIASDITPHLVYGTVLDNQKAFTVLGTYLQNARLMDVFYREGYTDIEMEAGPYLSAVFFMKCHAPNATRLMRSSISTGVAFDLGILHYASDTPLSKGKNPGCGHHVLLRYGLNLRHNHCNSETYPQTRTPSFGSLIFHS